MASVFQKLGSLNSEPALPSTSYLPATPSVVPASSYVPSSETPPGERPAALPQDLRLALGAGGRAGPLWSRGEEAPEWLSQETGASAALPPRAV